MWALRFSGFVLAALGLLSVANHDFAFQWQPVPPDVPGRAALAVIAGIVEIAVGGALWSVRWQRKAAVAGSLVFFVWMVLHLPAVARTPLDVAAWLGVAETAALTIGLWLAGDPKPFAAAFVRAYGLALVIFGLSHFVYAEFTASMIQQWLPARLFLAYLTGAIHIVAGIAVLLRFRTRLAATLESAMMFSFVVLVHVPRVVASPGSRIEWTMLLVACALSCSAWQVAQNESQNK